VIRPRSTRAIAFLCVSVAAVALAACSSSSPSSTTAPTTAPVITAPPTTVALPPVSTTGAVPAVASPTDQGVEPVISADTAPAPSTDVIKDLVVGTGATTTLSDTVDVMYVGALYTTGVDFDQSTWQAKMPTAFPLNEVVPGFAQGLEGMKVGGRREIVIPAALGYGAMPPQGIPANATLVFVVDLKSLS